MSFHCNILAATTSMFLREIKYREDLKINFNHYPFSLPALNHKDFIIKFPSPVTFLVGENGSGKSTILEAIALSCGFNIGGGSKNNIYEHVTTESNLADYLTLVWNTKVNNGFFFRAETFFNFASYLDDLSSQEYGGGAYEPYGGKSLHQQSHGESFLALFNHRLHQGLFIFDEPEAALSPKRQLAFLAILDERVKSKNCQFIIATHSPILMSYPDATIYEFTSNGIKKVKYQQTEHYTVTKDFLDSPESFHKHLFSS